MQHNTEQESQILEDLRRDINLSAHLKKDINQKDRSQKVTFPGIKEFLPQQKDIVEDMLIGVKRLEKETVINAQNATPQKVFMLIMLFLGKIMKKTDLTYQTELHYVDHAMQRLKDFKMDTKSLKKLD